MKLSFEKMSATPGQGSGGPGTSEEIEIAQRIEKASELKKFIISEDIKGVGGKENVYAVLYDAELLLRELVKQRADGGKSSIVDSMRAAGFTEGRLLDPNLDKRMNTEEISIVEKICPDYVETEDSVHLAIFSNDNEQLAVDLAEYLENKIIALYNKSMAEEFMTSDSGEVTPNITDELKKKVMSNFGQEYNSEHDPIPEDIRSKDQSMDLEWEQYPGISSQMRITNTYLAADMAVFYPFVHPEKFTYLKRIKFNNPMKIKGYVSGHGPDLAAQLQMLLFLKQKGHTPVLTMAQNASNYYDSPGKKHFPYAV